MGVPSISIWLETTYARTIEDDITAGVICSVIGFNFTK